MAATHFEGKFKGNGVAVPKCREFALSPAFGNLTTDAAAVTCSACCKQIGKAAPVKASAVADVHFGRENTTDANTSACLGMIGGHTGRYVNGRTTTTETAKVTCTHCRKTVAFRAAVAAGSK